MNNDEMHVPRLPELDLGHVRLYLSPQGDFIELHWKDKDGWWSWSAAGLTFKDAKTLADTLTRIVTR